MEENVPAGSICCFCKLAENDEALFGKFYKYQDIITHYFCLLLASKILQRGTDEEGILGFLPKDITNEVKRSKTLKCIYCGKTGATVGCCYSKCRAHFHLPCGRKRDTFHQFFGQFKSYCHKHRLKQKINAQVLKAMSGKESVNCIICLEPVSATPAPNTLWAPCCSKEAWFHRLCVQRLALSAGYFFKCPLCNNTKQFVEAMRTYGIWVPEQDASWEAEPERYSSLLERHNSCDAKSCRCRQGRTFHVENTKWEIKLCSDCGSQGIHVQCGNLGVSDDWACPICSSVTVQKENFVQASERQQGRQNAENGSRRSRRTGRVRRVTRQSQLLEADDEDEEVDVVGVGDEDEGRKLESNEQGEGNSTATSLGVSSPSNALTLAPLQKRPRIDILYAKKKVLEPHSRPRMNQNHSQSEQQNPSQTEKPSEDTRANTSVEKKCNYEIIDIDDNSDDDVQILYTPNIKFIKTNEGLSVPVVKVLASSAPSGDGVVACGEPCQSSLSAIPTIDLEDDCALNTTKDECLPSTSKSFHKPLNSAVELLDSGDPSQSDDDIEIMEEVCKRKPRISSVKPSLIDSSTQTSKGTDAVNEKVGLLCDLLTAHKNKKLNLGGNSKSHVGDTVNSSSATENTNSVSQKCVSSQTFQESLKPCVIDSSPSKDNMQSGRLSVIHKALPSADGVRTQSVVVPPTKSIAWQEVASELVSNQWINDPSHVLNPGLGPTSTLGSNSQVTMVTSSIPVPPSLLPAGTSAVISTSIPTSQVPCVSTQDLVTNAPSKSLSKSTPVHLSHPVTAAVHHSLVNNARFAISNNENIKDTLFNATHQVHSGIESNSLFGISPLHGQANRQLPTQISQDDWSYSVQVVPGSESISENVRAFNANDHPEVIMERNPGPVPFKSSLWAQMNGFSDSSLQAGDGHTDATTNGDQSLEANTMRERKQKLVERPDYDQCLSASNPYSATDHCQKSFPVAGNETLLPASVMVAIPSNIMPQVAAGRREIANNIYIMVNPLSSLISANSSQNSFQN